MTAVFAVKNAQSAPRAGQIPNDHSARESLRARSRSAIRARSPANRILPTREAGPDLIGKDFSPSCDWLAPENVARGLQYLQHVLATAAAQWETHSSDNISPVGTCPLSPPLR